MNPFQKNSIIPLQLKHNSKALNAFHFVSPSCLLDCSLTDVSQRASSNFIRKDMSLVPTAIKMIYTIDCKEYVCKIIHCT